MAMELSVKLCRCNALRCILSWSYPALLDVNEKRFLFGFRKHLFYSTDLIDWSQFSGVKSITSVNKAIHQYRIIEKHISLCRSRAEKSFYFLTKGFKSIHAEHLFRLSMFANTNAKSHAKVFHNQNTILASRTYHGELWSSVTTGTWY